METSWTAARALRQVRERQGLTQQQVATRLGMTRGNYGHYEQGRQQPTMGDVPALATAMGVHPCSFFQDQQSGPSLGDQMGADLLGALRGVSPKQAQLLLGMLRVIDEAGIE